MILGRLEIMSGLLIPGQPAADIGADHALLAIYLIEKQIAPWVIATELGDGPYQRLCKAVSSSTYADLIQVRRGDGLQPLQPEEVSNVVIAGMGGDTMVQVLSHDWNKASSFERFILQPMSRPGVLRLALACQGWELKDEKLVRQNRHYFSVIMTVPGNCPYHLSPLELDVGPILLRRSDEIAQSYRQQAWRDYKRMRSRLALSNTSRSSNLLEEVENKLNELEAYLR